MKTKITILALFVALFGFTSANAQSRGYGKYKQHKEYEKYAKKYYKHHKYDNKYRNRDVVYKDYYGSRRGIAYYPPQRVYRTNLPPGRAKKIYGHQSAKAFAPGQQKKRYNNVYAPQRRVIDDDRYSYNDNNIGRRLGVLLGL